MTVVAIHDVANFAGLSTDVKPTATSPGSTFLEVDTGYTYICLDGVNWTRYDRFPALSAGTNLLGKVGIDQVTSGANGVVAKAGTALIGKVGIDQATANANEVVVKSGLITLVPTDSFRITVTMTVTNDVYTISDVVGGLLTFANAVSANGKSCIIDTLQLAAVSALVYDVWLLQGDIATPALDNAAFALAAADLSLVLGVIPIAAADYKAPQSSFNVATIKGLNLVVKAGAGTKNLYAYMKATATTTPGTDTLYMTITGRRID